MENEDGEKPTFAWTFLFKDLFYTKRLGDYSTKTAVIAGGAPIFDDLKPEETGNEKLSPEDFFVGSQDADFLIYDSINGRDIQSVGDLVTYADYMADMKSVKNDNVWSPKPHYYQSADYIADMIEDLYEIFHNTDESLTETEYFFKMEK